ncbi:MAG: toprim domain-containing protein [Rhodospirillales bacterium]|nr:toprim domain-containing protein [Rhodospirillales bacterium]
MDIIRESAGLISFRDVAEEAQRFLGLPKSEHRLVSQGTKPAPRGSPESARRLFAMSRPIAGTLAEVYLRHRGIVTVHHVGALRFHPRCYYRPDEHAPTEAWPAMVACVTDPDGRIVGVHRTWLDRSGRGKAPIETPRRAIGELLGNAVRFGVADDVLTAAEGIETMLSLRCAMPTMPMVAALSANHLAALLLPATLRQLYIARDADPAGDRAAATLSARAQEAGIEAITLSPRLDDFNDDLRAFGVDGLRAALRHQLAPRDAQRFCDRMMPGKG